MVLRDKPQIYKDTLPKEGLQLYNLLKDHIVVMPLCTPGTIISSLKKDLFDLSVKNTEKQFSYFINLEVDWHLGKILASIIHDDVQQYTFESVDIIRNVIEKNQCSKHVVDRFVAGCKLLISYLLDSDNTDIAKVESYLGLVEKHASLEAKKDLAGEKFRLALKKQAFEEVQSSFQELKEIQAQLERNGESLISPDKLSIVEKSISGFGSHEEKLVSQTCSNIEEALISKEQKQEDKADRKIAATAILKDKFSKKQYADMVISSSKLPNLEKGFEVNVSGNTNSLSKEQYN